MSVSETLADLTGKVADLYKELVTNSVRFEELRRHTTETLGEFKHALERMADKIDALQKEQVQDNSALKAEIHILRGRLDTLSEQALHIAVKEAAREVAEVHMRKPQVVTVDEGTAFDALPPGDPKSSNPIVRADG